ncbi:hypothetical protein [Bifidobacterium castoris]|uniref:Uncharacterized protein n=1 Tax=Bifidobacterium castoris TaxID=2306972 RepID=A0A430F4F4_9BIFI|nr:hypothetical protein [Bifidobacterium castoris]RSX44688.1 hypothetical protein D2E22_1974 [Bifidobacterium castoris]
MQYFNASIETMVRDFAGDFADDFDIDAIVADYIDQFDAKLVELGYMASLHDDGSVTEWDWADMPGWNERTPLERDGLDVIAAGIDLGDIMARRDLTA